MRGALLSREQAEHFLIATGEEYRVHECSTLAAAERGVHICLWGQGAGKDAWVCVVETERALSRKAGDRAAELGPHNLGAKTVRVLLDSPAKAERRLRCVPEITAQQVFD